MVLNIRDQVNIFFRKTYRNNEFDLKLAEVKFLSRSQRHGCLPKNLGTSEQIVRPDRYIARTHHPGFSVFGWRGLGGKLGISEHEEYFLEI